mmetsp:Transcript_22359/g.38586  ORF Transcript_22359/g.38586 Transcript_22359/m.38586 type:complete len:229 (-) Transcript_22359:190-876(-)
MVLDWDSLSSVSSSKNSSLSRWIFSTSRSWLCIFEWVSAKESKSCSSSFMRDIYLSLSFSTSVSLSAIVLSVAIWTCMDSTSAFSASLSSSASRSASSKSAFSSATFSNATSCSSTSFLSCSSNLHRASNSMISSFFAFNDAFASSSIFPDESARLFSFCNTDSNAVIVSFNPLFSSPNPRINPVYCCATCALSISIISSLVFISEISRLYHSSSFFHSSGIAVFVLV